jgi:hypothetical protein
MNHVVVDGDCLQSIARRYGLGDGSDIWNAPQNASIKQRRGDGSQLHPGDVLFIPPPKPRTFSLATGKHHKLVVPRPKRQIRVQFLDHDGEPMKGDYVFKSGAFERKGPLGGDGVLELKIPAELMTAEVTIGDVTRTLRIGSLNPLSETDDDGISGAQARLANLGYYVGAIDGEMGPMTEAALRSFQEDSDLDATGELDDATVAKLTENHGC